MAGRLFLGKPGDPGHCFDNCLVRVPRWDLGHHRAPYRPGKLQSFVDRRLPLVVWLALFARVGVQLLREWLRRRQSQSWPWAESTIEGGSIQDGSGYGRDYKLTVTYSYFVKGERYGGVWADLFSSESDAQAALESLRSFPPPARYKPADPSVSMMNPYRDAVLGLPCHGAEGAPG